MIVAASHATGGTIDADVMARAELTVDRGLGEAASFSRRVRIWFAHRAIRWLMLLYELAMSAARAMRGGRRRHRNAAVDILITGSFYSDNWVRSHLGPLAASRRCGRVRMVSVTPVPAIPKVKAIYPPAWLRRWVGAVPARLIIFVMEALRERPDIIAGFHLLVNGLAAALLAKAVGVKSMYFCVGGPKEVLGGGVRAENRLFGRMETSDEVVERQLVRAVAAFDEVITMGSRAVAFFREKGIDARFHVVAGGIDGGEFQPAEQEVVNDLVLVGRLVEIKRVDVFLRAVKCVADQRPDVTATIVGDGELRASLEQLTGELGIAHRVKFVGHQKNVGDWLRQSKVFVLTSDSEGLALSLMEAMMCGRPAVVSRVGDLADLVEDGVNGYLVPRRSPGMFAARIVELLSDDGKWLAFSQAARRAALRFQTATTVRRWDEILCP